MALGQQSIVGASLCKPLLAKQFVDSEYKMVVPAPDLGIGTGSRRGLARALVVSQKLQPEVEIEKLGIPSNPIVDE